MDGMDGMDGMDDMDRGDREAGPGFGEAVRFWTKLGFVSFGGPAGQIAIMHRELVERRRWISEERFLHALSYCMLLPGPEAQQLATYVGWLLHRVKGGLAAGALFVLPSVFVLLALSWAYAAHGEKTAVAGALSGLRPVVVAIVADAALRVGRRALRGRAHWAIAAAAFVALHLLGVPFPAVIAGAAVLGWLGGRRGRGDVTADGPAAVRPSGRRVLRPLAIGLALWLAGLGAVVAWRGADSVHAREYAFFTKAALVTFGGAYAVLGYVRQAAVETYGWLDEAETVDGLALAETTPGPLIMVVQFVGFVASWHHPEGLPREASAVVGALLATWVTFLPSFLFIFVGAPWVEVLRAHRGLAAALAAVTAAVVGVIADLAVSFADAVLLPAGRLDATATALAVAAFLALWRLRVDVVAVVVGGALIGLATGTSP